MRMRPIVIMLLLAAGAATAQDKNEDTKKRMVFPAGPAQPAPAAVAPLAPGAPMLSAAPLPLSPGPVQTPDPMAAADAFFAGLKSGQVDAAYDELVRNTIIADRKQDVEALKAKTKQALDSYGPVNGYEPVETVEVGTSLRRLTCISLNADLPLRWKFYFYRTAAGWRLVDLRVDDGLAELFDDVSRNRKK